MRFLFLPSSIFASNNNAFAKKFNRLKQWAFEEEKRTFERVGGVGCGRRGSNAWFSG
jgi:hypothetical protein